MEVTCLMCFRRVWSAPLLPVVKLMAVYCVCSWQILLFKQLGDAVDMPVLSSSALCSQWFVVWFIVVYKLCRSHFRLFLPSFILLWLSLPPVSRTLGLQSQHRTSPHFQNKLCALTLAPLCFHSTPHQVLNHLVCFCPCRLACLWCFIDVLSVVFRNWLFRLI